MRKLDIMLDYYRRYISLGMGFIMFKGCSFIEVVNCDFIEWLSFFEVEKMNEWYLCLLGKEFRNKKL